MTSKEKRNAHFINISSASIYLLITIIKQT